MGGARGRDVMLGGGVLGGGVLGEEVQRLLYRHKLYLTENQNYS